MTQDLELKIEDAIRIIRAALTRYSRPCVFWSGGKDSMVILHLLRSILPPMSVVCWREPWLPAKQAFVNRMISEWELELWDYAPAVVTLCEGNGRIDVINHYQIGKGVMALARGTEPADLEKPWICGRDTFLSRPTGSFNFPWDLGFHGHKSVDVDPTSGQVPLKVDISHVPGSAASCFPLRHWTDEDVFAYIEKFNVPYDQNRYQRRDDGTWKILSDKTLNPDYYATCFECCRRDRPVSVLCPKLNLEIENISTSVPYVEPSLAYCGLRTGEAQ